MIIDITTLDQLNEWRDGKNKFLLLFTDPLFCGPCRIFEPHYEAVAKKIYHADIAALRVVVANAEPELLDAYAVMGVPSLFFIDGDKESVVKGRTVLSVLNEIEVGNE